MKAIGLLRFFEGGGGCELGNFCSGAFILALEAPQLALALSDFERGAGHLVFFTEVNDSTGADYNEYHADGENFGDGDAVGGVAAAIVRHKQSYQRRGAWRFAT